MQALNKSTRKNIEMFVALRTEYVANVGGVLSRVWLFV